MFNDLEQAKALAAAQAARRRASGQPAARWLRETVYVLEGCACPLQGPGNRYHVHTFDAHGLAYWLGSHAGVRVAAAYPV